MMRCYNLANSFFLFIQKSMLVGVFSKPMKLDTPDRFNLFNINSSLFYKFDNNSIIELKLRDQKNDHSLSL